MGANARPKHGARNRGKSRRRKKLKRRTRQLRIVAKRTKRSLRARSSRQVWQMRPWWEQRPLELGTLMHEIEDAYPDVVARQVGRALVVNLNVELDTLQKTRRLALVFPGPPSRVRPIVMSDGPTRSRHRFTWARPTSLCLYYAPDHEGLRWKLKDGIVALIDLSRVHLIKEAWWRVTGEWEGYEVHRRSPSGTEQKPRAPKDGVGRLPTDKLRQARFRCWCGTRRYVKCHKAIPEEQELRALGLVPEDAADAT
jgi:hypothetical protein